MNPRNPFRLWQERVLDRRMDAQVARVEAYLDRLSTSAVESAPVLFFNASTRIHRLSLNAGYSLLASWILRAKGQSVRYLVCHQGMVQCILGTQPQKPASLPPCKKCIRVSQRLFPEEWVVPYHLDLSLVAEIQHALESRSLDEMIEWTYAGVPLGQLVLPGLRWALRRHHLVDDEKTRIFYRQYLSSAASMIQSFELNLTQIQPSVVVLFNGIFYPEALLRYLADRRGIPVVTHEVGLQPFSTFFSHQEATFREVEVNPRGNLTANQQAQLDDYLAGRYRGEFSMAGIQFWETMQDLPDQIQERLGQFSSIVPVFTNVVFDTSQIHANTLFEDMFDWLDHLIKVFEQHPKVLFVIRAHPDEDRPGKASQESVSDWVRRTAVDQRENVIFIGPGEELSSYKLIEQAKLVLVYNSSVGLEASILGKPVLCAGRARYTQADTVFYPGSSEAYWVKLKGMLAQTSIELPEGFRINAQKFLFHELYRASLDLSAFLEVDPTLPGMVVFRAFDPVEMLHSTALDAIYQGVVQGRKFVVDG